MVKAISINSRGGSSSAAGGWTTVIDDTLCRNEDLPIHPKLRTFEISFTKEFADFVLGDFQDSSRIRHAIVSLSVV